MTNSPFKKFRSKEGFSIVEVVFGSFFGSLVLGGIIVALLWSLRIYRDTIAIAELTTASRMLREKVMYHLVRGEVKNELVVDGGGLASLDLKTCRIDSRNQGLAFSIEKVAPARDTRVYRLEYSPSYEECGFDLEKIRGKGIDNSFFPWFPVHSVSIQSKRLFRLKLLDDDFRFVKDGDGGVSERGGANLTKRYFLSNDFDLFIRSGNKDYSRKCHIGSPIVNDFTE